MPAQSLYTEELAEAICKHIAEGGALKPFLRQPGMPNWSTVYAWIAEKPDFAERMELARQMGADAIAEEAMEIADTTQEGVRTETSEDGHKEVREDMLGHRKLRVWTRLQLLAKWHPKKYGTKVEHAGSVSGFALVVNPMPADKV